MIAFFIAPSGVAGTPRFLLLVRPRDVGWFGSRNCMARPGWRSGFSSKPTWPLAWIEQLPQLPATRAGATVGQPGGGRCADLGRLRPSDRPGAQAELGRPRTAHVEVGAPQTP